MKEREKQKEKIEKYAADKQTGKIFRLNEETLLDIIAATFSILYLITMLVFFSWQLFDVCTSRIFLLKQIFPQEAAYINSPLFRLIACTVIGGGLGGVVNGIRSLIVWHAERRAFGWRFVWKYITLPLIGVILAAIVYAIIRSGIAVFGGNFAPSSDLPNQILSAFGIGALTGYGSQKVFVWLDNQVNKLFKIAQVPEVRVPDLRNKTQAEAKVILKNVHLNIGKINKKISDDPTKVDKVIDQSPSADSIIPKGGSVDIVIATKE